MVYGDFKSKVAQQSTVGDQYHTLSPHLEPLGKERVRALNRHLVLGPEAERRGLVTPGDNMRGWPRILVPGELI